MRLLEGYGMQQWRVLLHVGLLLPVKSVSASLRENMSYPSRPSTSTLHVSYIRSVWEGKSSPLKDRHPV